MDGEAAQHKERAHVGTFFVSVCRGWLGRKPNTKNASNWTRFLCCRAVEAAGEGRWGGNSARHENEPICGRVFVSGWREGFGRPPPIRRTCHSRHIFRVGGEANQPNTKNATGAFFVFGYQGRAGRPSNMKNAPVGRVFRV